MEIEKSSISRNRCARTAMMNGHSIQTLIMRKIAATNVAEIGVQPLTGHYAPTAGANLGKGQR